MSELLATRRGAVERVHGELRDRGAQQCTGDDVAGIVDARYVDPLGVRSPAGESAPRRGGVAGRERQGR